MSMLLPRFDNWWDNFLVISEPSGEYRPAMHVRRWGQLVPTTKLPASTSYRQHFNAVVNISFVGPHNSHWLRSKFSYTPASTLSYGNQDFSGVAAYSSIPLDVGKLRQDTYLLYKYEARYRQASSLSAHLLVKVTFLFQKMSTFFTELEKNNVQTLYMTAFFSKKNMVFVAVIKLHSNTTYMYHNIWLYSKNCLATVFN